MTPSKDFSFENFGFFVICKKKQSGDSFDIFH